MKIATLLSTLIFLAGVVVASEDPQRIALVVASRGEVSVVSKEGVSRAGTMGSAIFVGDRLLTKSGSTVELVFLDGSKLALAGEGDLSVDEYAYGGKKKPTSVIAIKSGIFSFMAGKIAKIAPENYKVETATATIGIRGSGGHGVVTPDGLTIATVPGHVLVVVTLSGEWYLLEDPAITLKVDSQGHGVLNGMPTPQPEAKNTVDLFPYRRPTFHFGNKRTIRQLKGDMTDKLSKKVNATRDIEIAPESHTPSGESVMGRLGKTLRAGHKVKQSLQSLGDTRQIKLSKETPSTKDALKKVGLTQMKALEQQFSDVVPKKETERS